MQLSNEQWEKIDEKYNGLLWTISHRISGDRALASLEDNFSDLQIAALEAVSGFQKKTGKTFDEFWGSKLFDQYIKTCLWNFKNNKGMRISKRYNITRDMVSISEHEEVLKIENENGTEFDFEFFLEELSSEFTEEQKEVLDVLVRCPSGVKRNGTVNKSKISKKLNKSWAEIDRVMTSLEAVLQ